MNELHKGQLHTSELALDFKEGERRHLCSNKAGTRSSSLEFNSRPSKMTEDMQIDFIVTLLVGVFLERNQNEASK